MLTVPADRHSCGHERSWIRWYEVLVSHGSWHQPKVGDVEQLHLVLVERAVVDHRRDDKLDIYLYIYTYKRYVERQGTGGAMNVT